MTPHFSWLQLVVTHITTRNANARELLAAQGLILRQPPASGAAAGADWAAEPGRHRDDAGCVQHGERSVLRARLPSSSRQRCAAWQAWAQTSSGAYEALGSASAAPARDGCP